MLPARLDGRGYGDRSAHPPIGPVYRHHPSPCGSRVSALRTHYAPIIDTRAQQVCRCVHVRRQPSRGYGNLPRCHSYTATVHPSPLWAGRRSSARCPSRPCQCRTLCRPINAWRRYLAHRRAQCVPTTVAYDDPSHHVPSNASCELDGPCEGGHRHCVHQPPLCPPAAIVSTSRHRVHQIDVATPRRDYGAGASRILSRGRCRSSFTSQAAPFVGVSTAYRRVSSRALRCSGGAPRSGRGGG